MAILFENFVRNFYRIHTDYMVRREDVVALIAADQVAAEHQNADRRSLTRNRKIIIDCKFT
jgi:hypothetical protein